MSSRRSSASDDGSNGSSRSNSNSIPSIQTTHFETGAGRVPPNVAPSSATSATSATAVSADQERQILLLMLLAQVCAMHDPTPRTFTVHVLELFERGILDRESIHFLFELGLVPSTVTSRGLLINGPAPAPAAEQQQPSQPDIDIKAATSSTMTSYRATIAPTSTELTLTTERFDQQGNNTTTTNASAYHSIETLRSLEAKAIRRQLSEHDFPPSNNKPQSKRKGQYKHHNGTQNDDDNITNNNNCTTNLGDDENDDNHDYTAAWDVEHFPLSLSRYQREFKQIALLNAGAFGSVYRAIRELDGCEYAIKKITFDSIGYSNETIQRVIREVHCLATVNDHPNIVRYYTSWLEPSWMTGGNAAAGGSSTNSRQQQHLKQLQIDAKNHASPQKLLQDIENLMDSVEDEDERIDDDDSSWSSSSSESYRQGIGEESAFTISSSRRRSSWGNSVEESSWSAYHSHHLGPWTDVYDDSYLPDHGRSTRRRSSNNNKKSKPKAKQYKYQISLYIQMQLCHPATLQDWIRERNRQVPEANHASRIGPALEIFHQLCSGLAHVHEKGIIHRDLKPANIFASNNGKVIKIGDFGLSKQLHDIASHNTRDGDSATSSRQSSPIRKPSTRDQSKKKKDVELSSSPHHEYFHDSKTTELAVVHRTGLPSNNAIVALKPQIKNEPLTAGIGTASYAAPEQVRSKQYGTAVDVFSLGLIFLELVCCFETEHERLHNFQNCRNQRVPSWLEEHYPHIASTILACTRPNAPDRPTAKDLLDFTKIKSTKSQVEVNILKGQLVEKDRIIAEKDKMIEDLRLEMERMRATLLLTNGDPVHSNDQVVVEDAETFEEE